ncbi:hypothetical protein GCM10012289_48500 [Nonomuraea cavernae]|uniref:Hint domain-containing protein n=1 Tax=Nonomuraea cavernae TaxID=2045107 RepID=A0A918DMD2_9ACTN|nr:hypothetical protein GCM10012289_48500 [Nonomuraea cavernae]
MAETGGVVHAAPETPKQLAGTAAGLPSLVDTGVTATSAAAGTPKSKVKVPKNAVPEEQRQGLVRDISAVPVDAAAKTIALAADPPCGNESPWQRSVYVAYGTRVYSGGRIWQAIQNIPANLNFYPPHEVSEGWMLIGPCPLPPAPTATSMTPVNGALVLTEQPILKVVGSTWSGGVIGFDFEVCDNPEMSNCITYEYWGTGLSADWQIPAGTLAWGRQYWWRVDLSDASTIGGRSAYSPVQTFTVGVRQPTITSQLSTSGVDGQEFHQQAGNYTTTATDAQIPAAGPPLSVVRSYNSMDTRRTGVFGAGWSTRWDMRIIPETIHGREALLVTFPDGREVRFADKKDGTFQPPPGMYATLAVRAEGGWRLMDKASNTYLFDGAGRLLKITDGRGRSQELTYDASGKLAEVTSPGGRSLTFQWSGDHVTSVSTDAVNGAPLTWTYAYNGDVLQQVCDPESQCTTYGHDPGSQYRSSVLDSDPYHYWRLGEATGSAIDLGWRAGNATYSGAVVRAQPGALAGTPDGAVKLTNSTSVSLPSGIVPAIGKYASLETWFKTSTSGTVMSISSSGGTKTNVLSIEADGKLRGSYQSTSTPIITAAPVNDGAWHHVVLTVADNVQTMYVDGAVVGTLTASITGTNNRPTSTIGGLDGWVDEFAVYDRPLEPYEVVRHYQARNAAPHKLTQVTLPSGRVRAVNVYEPTTDRLKTHTDQHGGTWQISEPVINRSTGTSTVTVTDPKNATITAVYDAWRGYRITSQTDQLLKKTSYTYDTRGFLSKITDPNLNTVQRSNDKRGNALTTTTCRASGNCQTLRTEYYLNSADQFDPRNDRVVKIRDARSTGSTDNTYATVWEYNSYGEKTKQTTPATTDFPSGRSTTIAYTDGSEAAVGGGSTPAGLAASQTDPRGNTWSYRYTSAGDLAEQSDPAGLITQLQYDAIGRPTVSTQVSQAHPAGVTTSFTYDKLGRLVTQTEPGVKNEVTDATHTARTTYAYDPDGNVLTESVKDLTGGDPERTTSYTYDDHGREETATGPEGGVVRTAWDQVGARTTVTDELGAVFGFAYTNRGELASRTLKNWTGSPVAPVTATEITLESFSYDPAGRLGSRVDAMGRKTSYTYFNDDLLSQVIADDVKLNGSTTAKDVVTEANTFDAAGNLTRRVNGGGLVRADYVYDAASRLSSEMFDPATLARVTTYGYDANDNVITAKRTAAGTTRVETIEFSYNKENALTRRTVKNDGQDLTTTWKVDDRGLITEAVDARGNLSGADPPAFTTTLRYDLANQLIETKSPPVQIDKAGAAEQGRITSRFGYDTVGRQTHTVDPDGRITTAAFDRAGRLTSLTGMSYTPPGGSAVTPKTTYGHDAAGRLIRTTDPRGHITTIEYDALNNPVRVTDPPASTGQPAGQWVSHYDLLGEELAGIDPTGARSEATYDDLGRLITQTAIERKPTTAAYTTKLEYNDAGDLTKLVLPGNKTTTYTVNAAAEVTAETDPLGDSTTFAYDLIGRPTKATNPLGNAIIADYDLAGRLTSLKDLDSAGATVKTTGYGYDAADNLTQITSGEGRITRRTFDATDALTELIEPVSGSEAITTGFGYDAAGARTRLTDGRGNATWTTYNSQGLIETLTEPATTAHPDLADRTWTHVYDVAGNETALIQPGGVRHDSQFDQLNRVTTISGSGEGIVTPSKTYGYDLAGRVTTVSDQTLEYNDRSLLTRVSGASGQTSAFVYDELGNPTQRVDVTGTTAYTWDNDNRLSTVTDPVSGRINTYAYDKADRLTSIASTNPVNTQAYTYDALDRIATHTLKNSTGGQLAKITYGWDKDDNLTSKTTAGTAGAGANTYGYDHAGRLTSWTGPDGVNTSYAWDASGNRTRAGDKTYTYDQRNRLTSGDGTDYTYTPRGTLATETRNGNTKHLTFDAFDRLINDGDAAYIYDAFDRVATRQGRTSQQRFVYAGLDNDIVAITDQAGTIQAKYGRDPLGGLLSIQEGANPALGALTDIHDDVIGTFSGTALASSAAYNPYGEVLAQTGTKPTLGYQGEYTDPDTGTVNMHARWYQPGTGTFASRDTWTLTPNPSIQANRYTYASGGPLTGVDPTGHKDDMGGVGGGGGGRGGSPAGMVLPNVRVPGPRPALDNTIKGGRVAPPKGGTVKVTGKTKTTNTGSSGKSYNQRSMHSPISGNNPNARENLRDEKNQCRYHSCGGKTPKSGKVKTSITVKPIARVQPRGCTKPGGCGSPKTLKKDPCKRNCKAKKSDIESGPTHGPCKSPCNPPCPPWVCEGKDGLCGPGQPCAHPDQIFIDDSQVMNFYDYGVDPDDYPIIHCDDSKYGTGTCSDGIAAVDPDDTDTGSFDGDPIVPIFTCEPAPNSFVPGTKVLMADGTSKPIEEVKIGDEVLATDPTTGRTDPRPVTALIAGQGTKHLVKLMVDTDGDGGGTTGAITATDNHPFWVPALRLWLHAGQLKPGMWLQTSAGTYVQISAIQKWTTTQRVHNLTINEHHTYHVLAGDQAILVHNDDPGRSNPDDVCSRGPYAEESIPARSKGRDWTQDEIHQNNRNGDNFGCHTCGIRDPGNKRGTWVKDHWPPSEWIPDGMEQRLYPQCKSCSAKQGGWVRQIAPMMRKIYEVPEW